MWLAELYSLRDDPLQEMKQGTTWRSAIRFALSRLVDLPPGRNTHYYYGICTYNCHSTHRQFWERIERDFEEPCIVTLNYDIMVEQALHDIASKHRTAPRCYYGGFQYVQVVRKMTDVTKRSYELVQLGNEFPLYKLHGSLNWAWEPHSPTLKIHQDVRAVFRSDDKFAVPAIIPPIPEKEMPAEFAQVWNEAHIRLSKCPTWIICGYSLPPYDRALCDFFSNILQQRSSTKLLLIDPDSKSLVQRWRNLAPNTDVLPLPGLPDALEHAWV